MSAPLTETQHRVVKRAAERIEAFPETHDQRLFFFDNRPNNLGGLAVDSLDYLRPVSRHHLVDVERMARCNTVACAAGHIVCAAIELGVELPDTEFIDTAAQKLAGLTDLQADILFEECEDRSARKIIARAARKGRWRVGLGAIVNAWASAKMDALAYVRRG